VNANEAILLFADEYSRMAAAYDRVVVPRFEPIARTVVDLLAPKPKELILDIATGTGLLARLIAPLVAPQAVVAIDLADEALAVASYRAGNSGLRNVRFEMMDARNIVYRSGLFDKIGSNLGLPGLGYDRTFYEAHRLLKPGGLFVFSEWDAKPSLGEGLYQDLLPKYRTSTPSRELALLREAVALCRKDPEAQALHDPVAVRRKLEALGFQEVRDIVRTFPTHYASVGDFLAFQGAWGWDERELREMPPEDRKALEADVAERLGDALTPEGFDDLWTIHFTVARA